MRNGQRMGDHMIALALVFLFWILTFAGCYYAAPHADFGGIMSIVGVVCIAATVCMIIGFFFYSERE